MRIVGARLYPLHYPFVGGGYATSYGARTHLDNLLIALDDADGRTGVGEISRVTGNSPKPTDPQQVDSVVAALSPLVGRELDAPMDAAAGLTEILGVSRNLICGVETALLDLQAREAGVAAVTLFGGIRRRSVPCYYSVGQTTPGEVAARLAAAQDDGYRVLQVKVGGDRADDVARVEAALAAAAEDVVILPDANGGWSVPEASAMLRRFDDPRLYWEEPCRTYDENRRVADRTGSRILLDQCMNGLDRYLAACRDGFAAAVGLKATILGSPMRARLARDLCIEHGIRLKVDDSWGADIGTALALDLALGVPDPLLLCGIDMRLYFERRCDPAGPVFQAASLRRGDGPGLGIAPDPAELGVPVAEIR